MPTDEEANAAISALNGTMLHGYKMNVEVSPENVKLNTHRKYIVHTANLLRHLSVIVLWGKVNPLFVSEL